MPFVEIVSSPSPTGEHHRGCHPRRTCSPRELAGCGQTACGTSWMRCRERSSREKRSFSSGQRPWMDFGHGLLGGIRSSEGVGWRVAQPAEAVPGKGHWLTPFWHHRRGRLPFFPGKTAIFRVLDVALCFFRTRSRRVAMCGFRTQLVGFRPADHSAVSGHGLFRGGGIGDAQRPRGTVMGCIPIGLEWGGLPQLRG